MPVKAGPNGTLRRYSSTNGRYISDSSIDLSLRSNISKEEGKRRKENERRKQLYLRAENSPDKYLFDAFLAIESTYPGNVQFVNEKTVVQKRQRPRELDIICKNTIIEVKSSKTPGCAKQVLIQKEFAERRNMKAILYAPNILPRTMIEYKKQGICVVKTKHDLIKEFKK